MVSDGIDAPLVIFLVDGTKSGTNRALDGPELMVLAPGPGLNNELSPAAVADPTFVVVGAFFPRVEAWLTTVGAEGCVAAARTGDFFDCFLFLGIAALFTASVLPFSFGFTRGH